MGGLAAVHFRRSAPAAGIGERMLAAAPHLGAVRRIEVTGDVLVAVQTDADWRSAWLARDGRTVAALCGDLDNASELARDLGSPGTADPAHLLLAGHRAWGLDVVDRLRGSFAGVVTDGRVLWVFRDHFGSRPLFCHDAPSGFVAASEIKQVVAGADLSREPDLEYLERLLFGGVDRETAVRGVQRIPRGNLATVRASGVAAVHRYWDPIRFVETATLTPTEALEGLAHALETATTRVLRGRDVVLLSGGLDSTALAAFAARAPRPDGAPPVLALSAVYPHHPAVDERAWIELVAGHLGMPSHTYVPTAASLDDVRYWVDALDGPVDVLSIPESAEAYRHARALGGRTVLNGEVAEHLLESRGYLLDHLLAHRRWRATGALLRQRGAAGQSRRELTRQVLRAATPRAGRRVLARFRPPPMRGVPPWLDADRMREMSGQPPLSQVQRPGDRWPRVQVLPFEGPGVGFESGAVCAALCGVDVRRPFADVDLWRFVLSLPAEVKFPDRRVKAILREAMRGRLPDAVLDREDKTYFDDYHLATADYPTLRRYLVGAPTRIPGVDYERLATAIERQNLSIGDLQWARDLVRVHAFLEVCGDAAATPA